MTHLDSCSSYSSTRLLPRVHWTSAPQISGARWSDLSLVPHTFPETCFHTAIALRQQAQSNCTCITLTSQEVQPDQYVWRVATCGRQSLTSSSLQTSADLIVLLYARTLGLLSGPRWRTRWRTVFTCLVRGSESAATFRNEQLWSIAV